MTGTGVPSWKAVAAESGARVRGVCAVCALEPEVLAQVHAAWDAGLRATFLIKTYLPACGIHDVSQPMIQNHFTRSHHVGAGA